ncbi:MAG TPA: ABC transporter ATP-binding protein [Stellaceae bacterium]|nr:ABC transporter ATP-binding protein [Stellaceae bacterium]
MTGSTERRSEPILAVEELEVGFSVGDRTIRAVNGVSFSIAPSEALAIVGESGSGKSTTGLAVMGLIQRTKQVHISGQVRLKSKTGRVCDVLELPARALRQVRGNDIAMIFQEPMSSLNPVYSIGSQIAEAVALHRRMSRADSLARALELLEQLSVPNPDKCLVSYPHQLSGGMRQRVMIAMALSCEPRLLIADEPTTALDVTVQAQIIELLKQVQAQTGMAIIFITHNLGIVSEIAHRTLVMYAGEVVESVSAAELFERPGMPYTAALLQSLPRIAADRAPATKLAAIPGSVPSAGALPTGCRFHPRCAHFLAKTCDAARPMLEACAPGHWVRCHRWRDIGDFAA